MTDPPAPVGSYLLGRSGMLYRMPGSSGRGGGDRVTEHPRDDLAAYALGALDARERRRAVLLPYDAQLGVIVRPLVRGHVQKTG